MINILPIEISFIFTIITVIGAFLLFKKTHKHSLLIFGTLAYVELLARILSVDMSIFTIPEILCLLFLIRMVTNKAARCIPIAVLVYLETIFYLWGTLSGYDADGLGGITFMMLFWLWYECRKPILAVDPWEK